MNIERRAVLRGVFIVSCLIILCVFITDWFFSPTKELMTEGILGMLIGGVIAWWGAYVAFHTTNGVGHDKPTEKETFYDE